ncbi:bifunctional (p)ppGpp synthetase/guanosine-3',5'-bis(diphosphate) 3'-pyrophosphohydrolase, partial [Candidatus Gribaldobacteria bacterium]|nr:bifunctional (p)ppGpp synthetase/guanosine-3',5'-bis(diphosphate) 3'-pyrophosphohydrolase [Candidatus Gribaldobacteria bacterium]
GATPLDFAYAIHSDIGEHCQSAKVNGKMVSLNKTLQTGQMVEILTNKNKSPSFDWLRIVKTQRAKNKIKEFFEKVKGISFKKEKEITNQDQPADNQKQEESGFKKSIRGTLSFLGKIIPKKKEDNVLIGKQTGIAYKIAKCCEPKKGDEIVAFLIKGEPASVHKKTCKNFLDLQKKFPPRVIEAEFA